MQITKITDTFLCDYCSDNGKGQYVITAFNDDICVCKECLKKITKTFEDFTYKLGD